jgi:cytidylate kinase
MSARVICLSRTLGAYGVEIGKTVADRLGFRYVDEEIVIKAAQKENLDPNEVAAVEVRKPFLQRLLEAMDRTAVLESIAASPENPGVITYSPDLALPLHTPSDYRELIVETIHETADQGKVVIVAHAAAMALGARPDTLRVLITGSLETRARRIAAVTEMDEQEAIRATKDSDSQRRDYFKRFYKLSEELPTHYDLVVNTDTLTPGQAVDAILSAAR